jgi:hypothetical protein
MYYPKSQIQTGFYSNGELVERASLRPYTGPYFNTSDGRSYTGKTLNDGPNLELIPPPNQFVKRAPTQDFEEGGELENEDPRFLPPNALYSDKKGVNRGSKLYSPSSYSPILTSNNIANGEFQRYIVKKSNENLYTEVNVNNFQAALDEPLYQPILLPWIILGEKEQVRTMNFKQVKLVESRSKIEGLGEFLNHDYLRFYQG